MQLLAPVTLHFPKRRHRNQSEVGTAALRCLQAISGFCCLLEVSPPFYNTACQLSGMFLAPIAFHTCHDSDRRSQEGSLRRLLNQIAQTRSQVTIAPSWLGLVILAHPWGTELHKVFMKKYVVVYKAEKWFWWYDITAVGGFHRFF